MKIKLLLISAIMSLFFVSCANGNGDKVECPTCDNQTQVLVGTKCVDITEISECGPDGHSHGADIPCHCYSDQEQTEINGQRYCLQNACVQEEECNGHGKLVNESCQCDTGYVVDEVDSTKCMPLDLDSLACDAFDTNATETKDAMDDFNGTHLEVETKNLVNLIPDKESFVHFPTATSTTFAVFVDQPDLLLAAYSKDGDTEFDIKKMGEDEDCSGKIHALYHIKVTRQVQNATEEPVVLKFDKHDGPVFIYIHEAPEDK